MLSSKRKISDEENDPSVANLKKKKITFKDYQTRANSNKRSLTNTNKDAELQAEQSEQTEKPTVVHASTIGSESDIPEEVQVKNPPRKEKPDTAQSQTEPEAEPQEPPTPTFEAKIFRRDLKPLSTTDIGDLKNALLQGVLLLEEEEEHNLDLDVLKNIVDIGGSKVCIKTKNFGTIEIIQRIMEPNETTSDINYYQPTKTTSKGDWLIFLELSYNAQKSFARHSWNIRLLGTNLKLTKHDAPRGTAPELEVDNSPTDIVDQTSSLMSQPEDHQPSLLS
ncbi:hypothetical protein ACHWQZ_G004287 [Mnemiopsis leidyi]